MTAPPTTGNWLSILALGVIWGGTFMVTSLALDGHGPVTVAAARTGFGALAILVLMIALGRRFPRDPRLWRHLLPIGVLSSAAPFFLLSWGQQSVSSAFAGLSMSALPIFVLPLAHAFTDERMSARKVTGVLMGFGGALVLLGPGLFGPEGGGTAALGELACLGAALCYALSSILTRRCPPIDATTLSAISLLIGSAILIPAMFWTEGVPRPSGVTGDLAIVVLGLIPTALAALIRVRVIQTAGSVFMTLVNYQVPIWSMLLGALVLGEALPARFFAALALILGGVAVSQWDGLRALRRRP